MVSTASRVVCGTSSTIERSWPSRRLNSDDLPTLGRPTSATRGTGSSSGMRSGPSGMWREHLVEQVPDAPPVPGRHRMGLAQAERVQLVGQQLLAVAVGLVRDQQDRDVRHGAAAWRSARRPPAPRRSRPPRTARGRRRRPPPRPARRSGRPCPRRRAPTRRCRRRGTGGRASRRTCSVRSRVTPGFSSTIATRRPRIRLTSVDLPTLGRPTTATRGSAAGRAAGAVRRARSTCSAIRATTSSIVEPGGVELPGVRGAGAAGRPRGCCRVRRGRASVCDQLVGDLLAELVGAAPGAFLGRGGQEHLEVGVGQDDRADVAALDHPAPLARRRAAAASWPRGPTAGRRRGTRRR